MDEQTAAHDMSESSSDSDDDGAQGNVGPNAPPANKWQKGLKQIRRLEKRVRDDTKISSHDTK